MSGNWIRLLRVVNPVKLCHCFGHGLCKKHEPSSVGLPFSKFGTDQLCWAEICNGIRSAARGRVDRCPARAAAAVSAADPTFRPKYSAHLKSLLQTALAPWSSLSVELIFFSPVLLLSKTVSSRKLCWAHLWYWLPDIKVDRKWSNSVLRTIFFPKMPLSNY